MTIVSLDVANFRCFERAEIQFDPRCTVISGENAEGKTSLLEAIQMLSTGRSFRTNHTELLALANRSEFLITGKIEIGSRIASAGLRWSTSGREIHYDGTKRRGFADLATALPVRVIDPSGHKLVEEGPAQRRRFVDWGVFHVEPRFQSAWRAYSLALAQRNAALKAQQARNLVQTWDDALATNGEEIGRLREVYLQALEPAVAHIASALLPQAVSLRLRRGWEAGSSLARQLETGWARDCRYRTTSLGPHRAEVDILVDGILARERISRGQQKLLACALVLAQLSHHAETGGDPGTLLLDDPAAELDVNNLGKLMRIIAKIPAQVVVTAVDPSTVRIIDPGKKFHVKQGHIEPVV